MEALTLEQLDLGVLEKVCQIFFDHLGFTSKPSIPPTISGVSGISVLYSKTSKASFALCQCAEQSALINLNLLGQFKKCLNQLKLASGYFITKGNPNFLIREFAAANKINLIDGSKLIEMISKLPNSVLNLLNEIINAAQAKKQANETGRHLRPSYLGVPPNCVKCGGRMELQISTEKHNIGKYWLCPYHKCGHIMALH